MFLDINGNTFSTLGNTNKVPVVNPNPLQLFGSDLKLWVDFTDKSTLFTDTACTTNVTTYGDYIRGIVDKSLNKKKLQKVNTTVTGSTDYQWSSNTFNTLGGCLRTGVQNTTSDVGFHHEDATFLTANTNYSFHFVGRIQGNTNNPALYSYGFLSNEIRIPAAQQRIDFINSSNQNNIIHNVTFSELQISTAQFNFSTTGVTLPAEFYESFGNNTYFSPRSGSTIGLNYASGKFRLFSRYGSSPPFFSSPVQNFYCQELYIVQGLITTEQLNLTHQYLRLKYL
jgi:hypothetical protein